MQHLDGEAQLSGLQTRDPAALAFLLSETLFVVENSRPAVAPEPEIAVRATEPQSEKSRRLPEFPFQGNKDGGILFIVDNADHPWMSDAAMDAFRKSLAALKLSEHEVALVNIARTEETPDTLDPAQLLHALLLQFSPDKVVLHGAQPARFGIAPTQLALNTPGTIQGATWLYTYDFLEMLVDSDKKRMYWNCIKTFFLG